MKSSRHVISSTYSTVSPAASLLAAFLFLGGAARADDPTTLVSGQVEDYALVGPTVYWHAAANCMEFEGTVIGGENPEVVGRIDRCGGPQHELFRRNSPDPDVCNEYQFLSEIVVDEEAVYWVEEAGLVKLGADANVWDSPWLFSGTVTGRPTDRKVELAQDADHVYAIVKSRLTAVKQVRKSDGSTSVLAIVGPFASNLQADGENVYWLDSGQLWRLELGSRNPPIAIASNISGYYAEGPRLIGLGATSRYVLIAQQEQVVRYNAESDTLSAPIYTSCCVQSEVYSLTSDDSTLYLFERRVGICHPFDMCVRVLISTRRVGPSNPEELYWEYAEGGMGPEDLTTDGDFLFWKRTGTIQRLPIESDVCAPSRRRGDANADDQVDISDASYLLNFLFLGGPAPRCHGAADANYDGGVDISDASYLLNFLFLGGPFPRGPVPDCRGYLRQ